MRYSLRIDGRLYVAVEVRPNRHRVLACDVDHVLDVLERLGKARLRERGRGEHDADDAPALGDGTDLSVGQISPGVVHGAHAAMAHERRKFGKRDRVVERRGRGVRKIEHHARTVHRFY